MKIIIDDDVNSFCSNKKLLSKYSSRQLEAIYELLFDRKFSQAVAKLLDEQQLVYIIIQEDFLEGNFWNRDKERYLVIKLKYERTNLPTM